MVNAICQEVHREGKTVQGYSLRDIKTDKLFICNATHLKELIKEGKISVSNLTVTKDNKIRVKKDTLSSNVNNSVLSLSSNTSNHSQQNTLPKRDKAGFPNDEEEIKKFIAHQKLFGKVSLIGTKCGNPCLLYSKNESNHLLYIPDNVTILNSPTYITFTGNLRGKDIHGYLKVVGGRNLTDINNMFRYTHYTDIDFTLFHTERVENMSAVFSSCTTGYLDLSPFNTTNVVTMEHMFEYLNAKGLNIATFKTPKLKRVLGMFIGCGVLCPLDVSSLDVSQVECFDDMFNHCKVKKLKLGNFNTQNAKSMHSMFEDCNLDVLNLSSFTIQEKTIIDYMFTNSHIKKLDLRKANIPEGVYKAFMGSEIDTLIVNKKSSDMLISHLQRQCKELKMV